jgi:cytochrome P450
MSAMHDRDGIDLDEIDLSDHSLFRHGFPHPIFTTLRHEAPIWKHPRTAGVAEFGGEEFWIISKHDDVMAISRDPEHFRSFEGPRVQGWEPERRGTMLITMDAPDHTRLRRLINSGFTPRMVAKLDEQSREWARRIVDGALEMGECNFVHEVAYKLPMNMIADIVGIPEGDREELFEMTNTMLYGLDPENPVDPDELKQLEFRTFMYGRELGAQKRANPTDDVWSTLTTAEIEMPDGTKSSLGETELDLFFLVLLVAGSETTRNSIAAGLQALVENPDQLQILRDDPSAIDTAVDEMIRWSSPVTYFRRTAVEDIDYKGHQFRAGDPITLWYPSADRDEDVFTDPFRFDVRRTPDPHVAFGGPGPHHCLGANLARREMKFMFEELVARVSDIEITGEARYNVTGLKSPVVMSLKELPVRLTAR